MQVGGLISLDHLWHIQTELANFFISNVNLWKSDFLVNKLWYIHMEYFPCQYISDILLDFN